MQQNQGGRFSLCLIENMTSNHPPPPDLHLVQNCSGTDRGGGGFLRFNTPSPSPLHREQFSKGQLKN